MTINELIKYLMKYADQGKGEARVVVAYKTWNVYTEAEEICNAVFMEPNIGERVIALMTE